MNKAINRTTVQVANNKYKVYPKAAPLFYKKSDGSYGNIDHTFNDTTSAIGDISLMDKGVVSVGKRKGNNPHKVVGIRPDNNQHLGTQQLEFSLVNVELDGESQDFNVEDDLEIKLKPSKVYQLVKINKDFNDFKIEFDIHSKGLDLQNTKYTKNTAIRNYKFNIKNLGEIEAGKTNISLDNIFDENNNNYIDSYVFKITDEYITTGQYTNNEEFGNSDLTNYTIYNDLYSNGSGMYYKDCLIFIAKGNNINGFEDYMAKGLANAYGCTIYKDDDEYAQQEYMDGHYFIKDNKKIGGYFENENNVFFAFINTTQIPDNIKTLFQRKTFNSTSYLDVSLDNFYTQIQNEFNKNLKIELDTNYYEPINGKFVFNINKEKMSIGKPILFDKDYNIVSMDTTHSLKENVDGSYRYTKYFSTNGYIDNPHNIKYIDATLYVSDSEDNISYYQSNSQKSLVNLGIQRNASTATSVWTASDGSSKGTRIAGDIGTKTTSKSGTSYSFSNYQTHRIFDSSGVSDTISSLSYKFKGAYSTVGGSHNDMDIILLKSNTEGGNLTSNWNDFIGHSTSSNWTSSVTEYSAEYKIDGYEESSNIGNNIASYTDESITLNSDAKTDLKNDDSFKLAIIPHDQYYNLSIDTTYGVISSGQRFAMGGQIDDSTTSNRPYLEYTTEEAEESVVYNANFFGANF